MLDQLIKRFHTSVNLTALALYPLLTLLFFRLRAFKELEHEGIHDTLRQNLNLSRLQVQVDVACQQLRLLVGIFLYDVFLDMRGVVDGLEAGIIGFEENGQLFEWIE